MRHQAPAYAYHLSRINLNSCGSDKSGNFMANQPRWRGAALRQRCRATP